MSQATNDVTTLKADRGFTLDRIATLTPRRDAAKAQVTAAAEEVASAKLAVDLRPDNREAKAVAERASAKLHAAVNELDELDASIERLQAHAEALMTQITDSERQATANRKAAEVARIPARLRALAPAVREFTALAKVYAEMQGMQVSNLGLLVIDCLSGERINTAIQTNPGLDQVVAMVASMKAALDRGEAP